jgi:hypothetical protein
MWHEAKSSEYLRQVLHRRAFLTDFGSFITGSFNEVGKVVFQRFFIAGVVKVF